MDNCNAKMADVARTGVPDISCTYWLYWYQYWFISVQSSDHSLMSSEQGTSHLAMILYIVVLYLG
jgi:hypothetical protein